MRTVFTVAWLIAIVFASFVLHELAHGYAGTALGFDMAVRLNGASTLGAVAITPLALDLITAAGPAFTLLQGLAAAVVAWATRWTLAFHVTAAALMMRMTGAFGSLSRPNDEARLGLSWGIGYWTLHVLVVGALALLTLWAFRSARLTLRHGVFTFLVIVAGVTLAVFLDRRLPQIVLQAMR
jgi:hypothetical protein